MHEKLLAVALIGVLAACGGGGGGGGDTQPSASPPSPPPVAEAEPAPYVPPETQTAEVTADTTLRFVADRGATVTGRLVRADGSTLVPRSSAGLELVGSGPGRTFSYSLPVRVDERVRRWDDDAVRLRSEERCCTVGASAGSSSVEASSGSGSGADSGVAARRVPDVGIAVPADLASLAGFAAVLTG